MSASRRHEHPATNCDYAVEADGRVVAVVERKSVDDLVSTIVGGKLWMLLAELVAFTDAGAGRGAEIVVEDRYSAIFKLRHVRPVSIATQLAEAAVRYPSVPIVFAETRQLAQEWAFRSRPAPDGAHVLVIGRRCGLVGSADQRMSVPSGPVMCQWPWWSRVMVKPCSLR